VMPSVAFRRKSLHQESSSGDESPFSLQIDDDTQLGNRACPS
jgi:hypothetical protein